MKNRWIKSALVAIISLVVCYIGISLWIGISVDSVVRAACRRHGVYSDEFSEIVSPEIFSRMGYTGHYDEILPPGELEEINFRTFPVALHWFGKGKVFYRYSYMINSKDDEFSAGTSGVTVTVDVTLQDGRWVITDFLSPPK